MDQERDHEQPGDLSALAWVNDELRRTLDNAHKTLRRHLRDVEAHAAGDPVQVSTTHLLQARGLYHQGVGALELIGLDEPARFLSACEQAVQRLALGGVPFTAESVGTLERAAFGLLDYLRRLLSSKPVSALELFPQYRAVLALAGAERVHPADLWTIKPVIADDRPDDGTHPLPSSEIRQRIEAALLEYFRSGNVAEARGISALFLSLVGRAEGRLATLWPMAAAFFEAQGAGLLDIDIYAKRMASRLLTQLRRAEGGQTDCPDRLLQDLLFFCARARQDAALAPTLSEVCRVHGVQSVADVDYEHSPLGRFDPAQVPLARRRVANLKESWSALAAGEVATLSGVVEQGALVIDSVRQLYPNGERLAASLSHAFERSAQMGGAPLPELAMEVATTLLCLDASLDDGDLDQPQLQERVVRLAERLDIVAMGQPPLPVEPWVEDLYRQVSDRQAMGSVVQELRSSLAEVEQQLDRYARHPGDVEALRPVPGQLAAMRGVLVVLGLDHATQAIHRMRDEISHLVASPDAVVQLPETLADNLGALSFLIDMLGVQPQLARTLFRFDPDSGRFAPVMGQVRKADLPLPAEQAPAAEPVEEGHPEVPVLSVESPLSLAEPDEVAAVSGPTLEVEPLDVPAGVVPPEPAAALASTTGPVPPPPAARPALSADDQEMLDIFLEEAREVIEQAAADVLVLRADPSDHGTLTSVRRAFHTLKGSSRMVGLRAFGEAAWSGEQLFNARLADADVRADGALLRFTADALAEFGAWTSEVEQAGHDEDHDASHLIARAQALRLGQPEPVQMPVAAVAAVADDFAVEAVPDSGAEAAIEDVPEGAEALDFSLDFSGLLDPAQPPLPAEDSPGALPVEPVGLVAVPQTPAFDVAVTELDFEVEFPDIVESPASLVSSPEDTAAPSMDALPMAAEASQAVELAFDFDFGDTAPPADDAAVSASDPRTAEAETEPADLVFDLDLEPDTVIPEPDPVEAIESGVVIELSAELPVDSPVFDLALDLGHEEVALPPQEVPAELPVLSDELSAAEMLEVDWPEGEAVELPTSAEPVDEVTLDLSDVVEVDETSLTLTDSDLGEVSEPVVLDTDAVVEEDLPALDLDFDLATDVSMVDEPAAGESIEVEDAMRESGDLTSADLALEWPESTVPEASQFAPDPEAQSPLDGVDLDPVQDVPADVQAESIPVDADASAVIEEPMAEAPEEAAVVALDAADGLDVAIDGAIEPLVAADAVVPEFDVPNEPVLQDRVTPVAEAEVLDVPMATWVPGDIEESVVESAEISQADDVGDVETPVLAVDEPDASGVADETSDQDDGYKTVGSLRIPIALFNIYLNEADEQSRRLCTALAEWQHELHRAVGEMPIALAHSLAGNSATVGHLALSGLARRLEHALEHSRVRGHGQAEEAELFVDTADEIRRLLHQFAAGFLKSVPEDLALRLDAHEAQNAEQITHAADLDMPDGLGDEALLDLDFDLIQAGTVAPVAPAAAPVPQPAPPTQAPAPRAERRGSFGGFDEGLEAVDVIDPELFEIFDEEGQELLPTLAEHLRRWESDPENLAAGVAAMRALHTFKGGARLAGAMRLGELAHRLETAIEHVTARGDQPDAKVLAQLQNGVDALDEEFQRLRLGDAAPSVEAGFEIPAEVVATATPVADAVPQVPVDLRVAEDAPAVVVAADVATVESEGVGEIVPAEVASLPDVPVPAPEVPAGPVAGVVENETASVQPEPVVPASVLPARAASVVAAATIDWARFMRPASVDAAAAVGPVEGANASVRVRAQLLDRLVSHAGEVGIARARIESDMSQMQTALRELTDNLERLRRQLRDLELQAETQMATRIEAARSAHASFDPLEMDRFTRVQELTRMMAESVNDVGTVQRGLQQTLQSTDDQLAAQARLTRDLQDDLLRARMVEFDTLSDRLYRVVRQAAKESGKQVRLNLEGGGIELDRAVLDRMAHAFEHLLRNAVVHGIEAPSLREALKKSGVGTVEVRLQQMGNEVQIEVRDDGAGLNLVRIAERARAHGLLNDEARPTEAELAGMIFRPGFTTVEQVTELAGRGVGMDVVRAEVTAMGGRIETATTSGQGTTFRMVLPLTTAVTQVVVLNAGDQTFAVPSTLVELVKRVPVAEAEKAYATGVLQHGQQVVPFFWAGSLLQHGVRGKLEGRTVQVVVVRSAAQYVALHVDQVQGNQEVVVKNLGPQLSRLPGLAGISVLATGNTVLIYNPVALAAVYGDDIRQSVAGAAADLDDVAAVPVPVAAEPVVPASVAAAAELPLVMVIDDSLTVRRVTQRLLQREGYRVLLAKDGLEALELLQVHRPAVMLCDIEMPRMDGFDLVRNVRGDARLADIPVIMITSRIAQKHQDHARELGVDHYLGKPYDEDRLLGLVRNYALAGVAA